GQADVVELARGLICDPDLPIKARANNEAEITKCIRCFTCFSNLMVHKHIVCALNPEISNAPETKFANAPAANKTVLIAGGGPAGMQAALTASKRGHKVILCEKSDRLGGVLRCEERVPFKALLHEYLEHQAYLISKTDIDVRLNTAVTPEYASGIAPDAVIAALGAVPAVLPIPGIGGENVYFAEEIYRDPSLAGEKTVVLGGGLVGTELAIYLAGLGKNVTVLEMASAIGDGGNILQGQSIALEIAKLKIPLELNTKVLEITKSGVVAESGGKKTSFEADTIVSALGMKPLREEAGELRFLAPEFHQIGDCLAAKNIYEATRTAHSIAMGIGRVQ
ncbi:MAG: FAD-dependent oxidoreductase, partial [Clostridiales bacterium]|nr:FAD-dependent oxidoreductase [Clostridiales bacterium]